MTDLALLKSRIALFAGQGGPPAESASDWARACLDGIAGQAFDAALMRDGTICEAWGAGADIAPHLAHLHLPEGEAFFCTAPHDPTLTLFLAARGTDMLVIRSQSIPIDDLCALWHAQVCV